MLFNVISFELITLILLVFLILLVRLVFFVLLLLQCFFKNFVSFRLDEILNDWNKTGISIVDILGIFSMIFVNAFMMFVFLILFKSEASALSQISRTQNEIRLRLGIRDPDIDGFAKGEVRTFVSLVVLK